MSRFVYRDHLIPMNSNALEIVHILYEVFLKEHGVICSRIDINRRIHSKWRREDVWKEVSIMIEVANEGIQIQAMLSDSIDQHW